MANLHLKKEMLEAVNNQLRENNPPAVKETLERLMKKGYSQKDAKERICAVLLGELYEILKNQTHFDEERYKRNLMSLE